MDSQNHLDTIDTSMDIKEVHSIWLKNQFRSADNDINHKLSRDEIMCVLNHMNLSITEKQAMTLFDAAHNRKHQMNLKGMGAGDVQLGACCLDEEAFLDFYELLYKRPELDQLFRKNSVNGTDVMGPQELHKFLVTNQKMTKISLDDCKAYIQRFEPQDTLYPGFMSIKGFYNLFRSQEFDIFNKIHNTVCEDMSQPLSAYYISSSHNTYLLGGQLAGTSSVEGYRLALLSGCRCVELDVCDGRDGEPIVTHLYTLTTKIPLLDVLVTIREYAFRTSKYPLILSLENNCSVDQQIKMAMLIRDVLKDYLYVDPVDTSSSILGLNKKHLPSPEALEYKILLKGKKLIKCDTKEMSRSDSLNNWVASDTESDDSDEHDSDGELEVVLSETETKSIEYLDKPEPIQIPDCDNMKNMGACMSVTKDKLKYELAKQLSDLVTYCVTKRFQSFDDCLNEKTWKYNEMISLKATKSLNLIKSDANKYAKFTKTNLVRVYPRGRKVLSGNYDPIPHWNTGAQLVALNYQTYDTPMIFNKALFALNGKCGYVLKPKYLRKGLLYGTSDMKPKQVKMTIISGQHIPKPGNTFEGKIIDPYVKLRVYGHSADWYEFTTNVVKSNGFNPIWEQTCEFTVRMPELAIIYIWVKDHLTLSKNVQLGRYAIPFRAIMPGYRTIRLMDSESRIIGVSTLLVYISFTDCADYWSPIEK